MAAWTLNQGQQRSKDGTPGMAFKTEPSRSRSPAHRPRLSPDTYIRPVQLKLVSASAQPSGRTRHTQRDTASSARTEAGQKIAHTRDESIYAAPNVRMRDAGIYAAPRQRTHDEVIYAVPGPLLRSASSPDADASPASMQPEGALTAQSPGESIYAVPHAVRATKHLPAPRTSVDSGYATPLASRISSTDSRTLSTVSSTFSTDSEALSAYSETLSGETLSAGSRAPSTVGSARSTDCDSVVDLAPPTEAPIHIPEGMKQVYPAQERTAALSLLMEQSADEKAAESPYATPRLHRRMSTALSASFRRVRAKARRALRSGATLAEATLSKRPLAVTNPMPAAAPPASELAGKSMTKDTNQANAGNREEAPRVSFTKRLRGFLSQSFETIATFLRYAFQK